MRHFSGSELGCGDKDTVQSNVEMPVGKGLALGTKIMYKSGLKTPPTGLRAVLMGPMYVSREPRH